MDSWLLGGIVVAAIVLTGGAVLAVLPLGALIFAGVFIVVTVARSIGGTEGDATTPVDHGR